MEKHFAAFTLKHIPRSENSEADELAKSAAQGTPMPPGGYKVVAHPSNHKRLKGQDSISPLRIETDVKAWANGQESISLHRIEADAKARAQGPRQHFAIPNRGGCESTGPTARTVFHHSE
jgi:hypothetical protein